ncbi:MAG: hypothetical protein AMJ69_08725 [Gammaproteobacteria bacterium SG8_47]|nr:MAG: hypothetical protein AMJ69_08725 [Gammaproteobacteria bacterium SG8_47]
MISSKQGARSLTAFIVTWSFLVLTVSGIVLYIVPQGRVAYWVDWSLLGLEKTHWANVHMMFGGVFIAMGILHLYFNWKPFKKYLAARVSGHLEVTRELVASVVISLLIIVGAIADIPPVSWVFDLNEKVKAAWVTSPQYEPPFGHAEEVSLKTLAKRTDLDLPAAVQTLRAQGIKFQDASDSIKSIAVANNMNPMQVYALISDLKKPGSEPVAGEELTAEQVEERFSGTGLGSKSLADLCQSLNLELSLAQARLQRAGVRAQPEERLRPIADRYQVSPIDILKVILVDSYRLAR